MTKQSKAQQLIDRRVETAYRAKCCGIQIDIMDIGKVFARGRTLVAEGVADDDLAAKLHEYVITCIAK
jgi:hypothetical protein